MNILRHRSRQFNGLIMAILATTLIACSTQKLDSNDTDKKIDQLLAKMTLEEKVGQMVQLTGRWEMTGPAPESADMQEQLDAIKSGKVGSLLNVAGAEATYKAQKLAVENSRLKIPLIFGYDVIHGYKTMFPIPLAIAASWEPESARISSVVAAREAAAAGQSWTFAPMVDVSRDARWGRVMESAGEDPFLSSKMGEAYVRGFQGDDLSSNESIAACAKHFAAYGFVEAGRDYNRVDIGTNTLYNTVLPPFQACSDAGVATFMNAFNDINGTPSSANKLLLRDILKGKWDFQGFVVSDWASIDEMRSHGFSADRAEAAEAAVNAGSDMDMEGMCYGTSLVELVESGKVDVSLIDDAVRRILRIKYDLGLFDDPYRYSDVEREKKELLKPENLVAAREIAKRSIVLLKNEKGLLPLSKLDQQIAVIGPLADDKDSPLGSWRGKANPNSAVSLLEGINTAVKKNSKITYALGAKLIASTPEFQTELEFNETDRSGFAEAVKTAQKADVVILAIGENCFQTGEGRSQTDITLKGVQMDLFNAIYKVNKNIVVVLMNGRALAIPELDEKAAAIVEAWHLGSEAGNAIADVLFGDYNPSGKLTVSFPRNVGQCPLYYNHYNTGRPQAGEPNSVFWSHYTDESNTPLYPFGYGLSYTQFEYGNIELSTKHIKKGESLTASIKVTNSGEVPGEEVVQLYIRDLHASIIQPVKALKGFQKINLAPKETAEISFEIGSDELSFYNANYESIIESGSFDIFIGTDSENVTKATFEVE